MPRLASTSGILEWITASTRPSPADAATLRFERMDSQAAFSLPEIHTALDPRDPTHWHQRGMIWDYVFALDGAQRILDVGPGDGWPALLLAPHVKEVVGIEPGPQRVAVCRANAKRLRRRKASFETMSACDLDFPAASFDGVVAATSIEQTPDPPRALAEILRVLRPGGVLRLSYEVVDAHPEPLREAVMIKAGPAGTYWIDYVIVWTERAEERGYLIEVHPQATESKRRLELWARRCANDAYPHRDPRLERGLAQTVRTLKHNEAAGARMFKLRHFRTPGLLRQLERLGFEEVRLVLGGGVPAQMCAEEMVRARRIAAAAPLMEEICRCAARIGLAPGCARPGNLIARKPERRARRAGKK